MNKFLVLLYFSLIFSYTLCQECSADGCSGKQIPDGEVQDHYVCAKSGEECAWTLLCNYAVRSNPEGGEDDSFTCSSQPVTNKDIYACVDNSESGNCKEVSICESIQKQNEADPESYQCSQKPVSDSDKFVCAVNEDTNEGVSACKELPYCSEDIEETSDCSKYPIKGQGEEKTKTCIKDKSTGKCKEEFLCGHNPDPNPDETLTCSNYPVSHDKKNTHFCNLNGGGKCGEEAYTCVNIPKPSDSTTITCSTYADDDHACIEDTSDSNLACKQIKKCLKVAESDLATEPDCSKYQPSEETKVCKADGDNKCKEEYLCDKAPKDAEGDCSTFSTSDKDHACVDDSTSTTNKCKENFYCSKVPKPGDNEDPIVCSNYELSNENKATHICIQNIGSDTYACKEEYLCERATNGANDEECAKYPVQPGNKDTHGCIKNSAGICKEENLCSLATISETVTDEICGKYPVAFIKIGTHICIKNPETSGSSCVEQPLCESVEGTNVQCENYPVKKENKNTHICVSKALGDNPCKEEKLCEQNSEATNDDECRKYPVTIANKNSKICIKNPSESTTGCIEKELCTSVTKGASVDCSAYPVSNEKSKTHTCKAVDGNDKCSEVEIDCSTTEKGESDEQCSHYKVSDTSKKCVKNTDTTAGASPCMEKALSACELKTSGATSDDVCNSLAVEKQGEQKCVKNPEGENCILLSYCQYGLGTSDTECAKFALQDSTKECKKKASENKCEEVEKTTPQGPGGNEETDTDSKENEHDTESKENEHDTDSKENEHDTDSKENETQGSDIDNTSDKADETKASDTTKTNPGTNGNNNNSGNYLNSALGLLLINYLVTLF